MGFRFRRILSIFPWLRLNIGKKGVSLSVGGKGAHVTIGKDGARTTVGLPGTGLSYTELNPVGHTIGKPSAPSECLDEAKLRLERLRTWCRELDEWHASKAVEVYVFHRDQVKGPIDLFTVTLMVTGKIAPEDVQICRVGSQEWIPIPVGILNIAMRATDFPLFFYRTPSGEKNGPHGAKTLHDMVAQDQLSSETEVFRRGDEEWKTFADFPELA